MVDVLVDVDVSGLEKLADRLEAELAGAVAKAAFLIEAYAKMNAPVDTGALRASLYTSTWDSGSEWGRSAASAAALRSGVTVLADIGKPSHRLEAIVAAGVNYASHVEYGTWRMSGRFYLRNAAMANLQQIRQLFVQAMQKATRDAFAGSRLRVRAA
jgi:HK97 gp10 family phage protein